MNWPSRDARAAAESAAATVEELGPEYADLYLRAAWAAAHDRSPNRTHVGVDDLSELGRTAERLCALLHELVVEGDADSPAHLHLVVDAAAGERI